MRKIIHVDMDAFYASIEQRDNPELRGKAVAVGGSPEGRGVVAAASYEARKFGVRSAMSSRQALKLCPHLIFVRNRMDRYIEVSAQIRAIFHEVTPLVEPLSLDEAYLDVTENLLQEPLAKNVAIYIKKKIREATGLTASAGVGPNKFIAKVASDLRKPDGLVVIAPPQVEDFVAQLPVEKLWGVGPVTAKKLHGLGFHTATDLRAASLEEVSRHFGKFGEFLHGLARGEDSRPVEPDGEAKSRGTEETFETDILDPVLIDEKLAEQVGYIAAELAEMESVAKTVTIKVRYQDFKTITRSRTLFRPTNRAREIESTAKELLWGSTEAGSRPIRLLGVSVSGFIRSDEPQQLWLDLPLP